MEASTTKAAHTPGPWNYGQESIDPEWWIVTLPGGLIVANVNAHKNQEANARLIAAAPAMLDALRAILDDAESGQSDSCYLIAKAAIARATGEA